MQTKTNELAQGTLDGLTIAGRGPLYLVAYVVLVVAMVLIAFRVRRFQRLLEHIKDLPARDRLPALREEMGSLPLGEPLSAEQYLKGRIHRYGLVAFLAVLFFTLLTIAVWRSSYEPRSRTTPEDVEILPLNSDAPPPLLIAPLDTTGESEIVRWQRHFIVRNASAQEVLVGGMRVVAGDTRNVHLRSINPPKVTKFGGREQLLFPLHIPSNGSLEITAEFPMHVYRTDAILKIPGDSVRAFDARLRSIFRANTQRANGPAHFTYSVFISYISDQGRNVEIKASLADSVYFVGMEASHGETVVWEPIQAGDAIMPRSETALTGAFIGFYGERPRTDWRNTSDEDLRRYVSLHDDDFGATLSLAERYFLRREYDSAEQVLRRYRVRDGAERGILNNNFGMIEFGRGNKPRALRLFEAALAMDCDLATAPYSNLREYYILGRQLDSAAHVLNRQIGACPTLGPVLPEELFDLMVDGANPSVARVGLRRAVENAPEDGDLHYYLGVTYLLAQEPKQAAQHLRDALELNTRHAREVRNNLADVLIDLNNFEEAQVMAETAIKIDPGHHIAHYHLAYIAFQRGNYALAVSEYQTVIRLEPSYENAYAELADVYSKIGMHKEADELLRRADEIRNANDQN
jgi:tetratricopeptide (TPR) repeat protein